MDPAQDNRNLTIYRLQSAFATEYGTFLGVAWLVCFALYVGGLRTANAFLLLLAMLVLIALPALAFYLAHRYKQKLPENTKIGFPKAYWFAASMFIYATLLTGAGEFFYFKMMDHGALIGTFYDLMDDPSTLQTYRQIGMENSLTFLRDTLDQLAALSPLEMVLALFNQNIFISLILAIPTAYFARKTSPNS
mgnify:CR=1 FL=1